jgi:methionyl aminopeptidase
VSGTVFAQRGIEIKSSEQIDLMRRAGLVVGRTLEQVRGWIQPGMTTGELDALAEEHIRDSGATPSFLGYHGFPASLCVSVNAARLGGRLTDVSAAVEAAVRSSELPLGIVEDYVGHGIGSRMHQPPNVPNFGRAGKGPRLVKGMAIAIEPMLTLGSPQTDVLDDDWTVVTQDGSWAAHYEHTVAITVNGAWVLTALDGGKERLTRMGVAYGGD